MSGFVCLLRPAPLPNFFGDNQGFYELTKVIEQAAKHTEVIRLRMEVHACIYELYILYSLLFLSLVNNLS